MTANRGRSLIGQPDRGSMLIEVTVLMVLVMLPLLYLVGTLGRVQAGAYAASAMARESARAYVTAPDVSQAPGRAAGGGQLVLMSHGFEAQDGSVDVSCPDAECLQPGSRVVANSRIAVELPLIPDFMEGIVPTTVSLAAEHTEVVDFFQESK
ncbi:pilus assembly protein [Ornithinimicrobium sp. INDO-MA30-4]|uniref:pilus assembly protein n=1 Tax=Ornithinimicrobium sp. INDO-MA30-4 TaxID=2908651 RepID=UPI001F1A880D|nr:pilus assembly protein [Ornithinimicrobium sp. INDO-MA30-4]UJH70770.1 pilus assembly protein [Ornithinimicrobium sp. INDO-MA30-4]